MNGLVNYGSSDSEDEEVPVQVQKQTPVKSVEPEKPAKIPSELKSSSALGSSLLASDFQLRMLSKQRSRAAKDGSKKRIFITAPSLDEDDFEETPQGPKKPKIQKSTKRSQLFSSLPKPQKSSVSMSSKVEIDVPKKSTPEQELPVEPPKPVATTTSLMPNSVKKKIKKPKKPAKPGPSLPPTTAPPTEKDSDSDLSDNEGGFFSFTSREEDEIELKKHKLNDVGPSRPSRDMLRKEREKFTIDPAQEVNYETTRHPNEDTSQSSSEEEDAIAPYGSDVAGYQAIAGPIRRASESFEESDAGLDIEGAAIRKLQGRRREEVQFVDAQVDKSLGNIRENIRKGAHQKHISTSIVDPLKEMKKSDPNAHVSKRTHQLKYLVELAKANETRLNQLWSNAKQSSRTTAQKYDVGMDDYVLYLTRDKFPPPAQSSLSGKRHTARISVVDQPCEDGLQVSWSVRAAPTIQFLPCTLIGFAVRRLIEVASDRCPVQVYFVLDQLSKEPWFLELIAYLFNATNINYHRPVFVNLVSEDSSELKELNSVLNCGPILSMELALPSPWRWFVDLDLPKYGSVMTMILESDTPVISDLFYSPKTRNKMTFVEVLYLNERSDLTLDYLNGIRLKVTFAHHVIDTLSNILNGGLMIVRLDGLNSPVFFMLQQHPGEKDWIFYGLTEPTNSHYPIQDSQETLPIPKISGSQLCEEMFTDNNFDFESLTRMTDEPDSPKFDPVDLRKAIKNTLDSCKPINDSVPISIPEVCFFSPNKILKNSMSIQDKLNDALQKQLILPKKITQSKPISSPVKRILTRNPESQCDLFEQRLHETATAASKKPGEMNKLKSGRLNLLSTRRRSTKSIVKPQKRERKESENRAQIKRDISGTRRGTPIVRRHTVADERSIQSTRNLPGTPESSTSQGPPRLTGSEKKKILLGIVKAELHNLKMTRENKAYKDCIRKLHEMCRTLIKGMGTTREELMPHMKRVAAANAQIVIDLCANAS